MRTTFIAAALIMAAPAWGQTSLSSDRFTVSTDNQTDVAIVGDSVEIKYLPYVLALTGPGSSSDEPPTLFGLTFAAQPGYVLMGEQVSFELYMNVDTYGSPATQLVAPRASFTLGINGQQLLSESRDAGGAHYSPSFTVVDPDLLIRVKASAEEGLLCPAGHEADGCGFANYYVTLDSVVELSAVRVTPLLSAIPEPGTAGLYLGALAAFAAAAALRSRRR